MLCAENKNKKFRVLKKCVISLARCSVDENSCLTDIPLDPITSSSKNKASDDRTA